MEPVRPWAYRIWRACHSRTLHTLASDGPALQRLIEAHGELPMMYAWALFVHDEQPLYHLEPVKHVDEFTSKKGNKIVQQLDNESAITNFPLAAFLKVPDAFIFEAKEVFKQLERDGEGKIQREQPSLNSLQHRGAWQAVLKHA